MWLWFDRDYFVRNYEPRSEVPGEKGCHCPVRECRHFPAGQGYSTRQMIMMHWAAQHRCDKATGALRDNSDGTLSKVEPNTVPPADRGEYEWWRNEHTKYRELGLIPPDQPTRDDAGARFEMKARSPGINGLSRLGDFYLAEQMQPKAPTQSNTGLIHNNRTRIPSNKAALSHRNKARRSRSKEEKKPARAVTTVLHVGRI